MSIYIYEFYFNESLLNYLFKNKLQTGEEIDNRPTVCLRLFFNSGYIVLDHVPIYHIIIFIFSFLLRINLYDY